MSKVGAVLTGRRTLEKAEGWGGNHSWGPAFVITHTIPDGWPRPDSTVQFVTEGLARCPAAEPLCRVPVHCMALRATQRTRTHPSVV